MLKHVFVHCRFTFSDHDSDLSDFHARTIGWQRLCVSHLAEPRVTVACFLFDFFCHGGKKVWKPSEGPRVHCKDYCGRFDIM